ncbi:MAG: energy-coupling factor transporter transmembrane protein EcfT [Kosmotoga sp.]|uniref:energy-coupling factor transporter transmembrane component T family protein n=1 Tax=Kosmotoga sp. TaxID=1955248 RepID=UPI001D5D2824|nr:energy-coupling factor transporter transmembrane component T [Kosmotoga sp.]MBO8166073.1 energy-coupling factor transporter transmembrane protein EcfT [Kosmotoga sp.]
MRQLPLGRFINIASPIHDLDARTKLIGLIGMAVISFFCSTPADFFLFFLYFFVLVYLSNIHIKHYLRSIRSIWLLLLMVFIFQLFFTPGRILLSMGKLSITFEGLVGAFTYSARIIGAIMFSTLLSCTTRPLSIAKGIESLMFKLKLPKKFSSDTGLVFSIALRFIPILSQEMENIMLSQKARGADFESRNLFRRIKSSLSVIIPLVVLALRKSEELAVAMDMRYYGRYERTICSKEKFGLSEKLFALMSFLVVLSILFN